MIKHPANIITGMRIIGAFALIACAPFGLPFFIIYTFCGLCDAVDGTVARKTGTVSHTGALFDSIADIVFLLIALFKILPHIWLLLSGKIIVLITAIVIIKLTVYIIGAVKFHKFSFLHTILNKLTGLCLFIGPYLIGAFKTELSVAIICIPATLAAVDELLCVIKMKVFNPDCRSIFEVTPK